MATMTAAKSASATDQLAPLLALIKDPDGIAERIAEYAAAEARASASLAASETRRAELDARERELIAREAKWENDRKRLMADMVTLANEREAHEKAVNQHRAEADASAQALSAREAAVVSREMAVDETEKAAAQLKRVTAMDRDEAAALLAKIKGHAADLASVTSRIAALSG